MRCRRAFVFSLDSFVAFTLIVAALYTLVFFSTVPSAYYSALTQANYLAKDSLVALATTTYGGEDSSGQTYLDLILSRGAGPARLYAGEMIPDQFGYKLEIADYAEGGEEDWTVIYSTATDDDPLLNTHKREYHKLKATAQALYLVVLKERDIGESPYGYITCYGDSTVCDLPLPYEYEAGDVALKLVKLTVFT
ncbi:MAG: hypothetical protein PHQ80_03410 [Candidatus ainarchaeum sp.]|nr:hypothetical protein [Candidatus ainarchaeum sp.]MDD5096540.1 hypothetical protein [Candidatus ainarchaeum sp.]